MTRLVSEEVQEPDAEDQEAASHRDTLRISWLVGLRFKHKLQPRN